MGVVSGSPSIFSRERQVLRALETRRRLERARERLGRAWINGREVGGTSPRLAHLGRVHD
jgi:hypothetical protein